MVKNELKEDNIIKGKEMIQQYCKAKSIDTAQILRAPYTEYVMQKYGFRDWESVLAAVGHGGLKEGQIVNKMQELYDREHKKELTDEEVLASMTGGHNRRMHARSSSGIVVKGIDDVAVRFSKCCSPVPGDEIVGFVTRGRGVSIHRTDCINVLNLSEMERDRLIDADWQAADKTGERYLAEISIYANNRNGLIADISKALTEKNIDILSLNTRVSKQGVATMIVAFEIGSREELQRIIDKVRAIDSVIDIERTAG